MDWMLVLWVGLTGLIWLCVGFAAALVLGAVLEKRQNRESDERHDRRLRQDRRQ